MEKIFPALFRGETILGGTTQVVELLELPGEPQEARIWGVRLRRLLVLEGVALPAVGERDLTIRQTGTLGTPHQVLAEDLVIVSSSGFVEEQPGVFAFERVDLETRTCPPLLAEGSAKPLSP